LGQKVFSKGKEALNLTLKKGEKVSFSYRVVVHEGSHLKGEEIDSIVKNFTARKQRR